MTKRWWEKWVWSAWEEDEGLKISSAGAQGLWMRCLCLAARAEPRGHVLVKGVSPSDEQLARITGFAEADIAIWRAELITNGVANVGPLGELVNRRMASEAEKRKRDQANGARGGNPALVTPPLIDQALDVIGDAERKKELARERTRKWRAAKRGGDASQARSVMRHASHGDVTVTHHGDAGDASPARKSASATTSFRGDNPAPNPYKLGVKSQSNSSPEKESARPIAGSLATLTGGEPAVAPTQATASDPVPMPAPMQAPSETAEAFADRLARWQAAQNAEAA